MTRLFLKIEGWWGAKQLRGHIISYINCFQCWARKKREIFLDGPLSVYFPIFASRTEYAMRADGAENFGIFVAYSGIFFAIREKGPATRVQGLTRHILIRPCTDPPLPHESGPDWRGANRHNITKKLLKSQKLSRVFSVLHWELSLFLYFSAISDLFMVI